MILSNYKKSLQKRLKSKGKTVAIGKSKTDIKKLERKFNL